MLALGGRRQDAEFVEFFEEFDDVCVELLAADVFELGEQAIGDRTGVGGLGERFPDMEATGLSVINSLPLGSTSTARPSTTSNMTSLDCRTIRLTSAP